MQPVSDAPRQTGLIHENDRPFQTGARARTWRLLKAGRRLPSIHRSTAAV